MLGAAAVIAQFVGGKAARDALFLAQFDVTALPLMVMAGSVFSIACAFLMSWVMKRLPPSRLVPAAFTGSAILIVLEWMAGALDPGVRAVVFYLHMLGVAPVLVSGFWTVLCERFDPRTAKRRMGHIGAAATFGGVAGSAIADRAAVWSTASTMLPVVAAISLACAWLVWRLAAIPGGPGAAPARECCAPAAIPSGLAVVARNAHLRNLAALVLLTTLGAALLDYVFKATAVAEVGRGDALLRLFALYYGAQSLFTVLSQVALSRTVLERLGLAPAVGSPALAVAAGGLGTLAFPGLSSVLAARASEYVCRMSLYRSAYELLYTPVPAQEKRAAKAIIDVAFERTGDLAGAGLTRIVLAAGGQHAAILIAAVGASMGALVVARRVTRGYVETLERSLRDHAVRLDLSEVEDLTTRETMIRTRGQVRDPDGGTRKERSAVMPRPPTPAAAVSDPADPVLQRVRALRSRDRERVLAVLHEGHGPPRALVPYVIPLLAWDLVAPDAIFALRKVAEESVGQLVDSLLDPREEFAVRRRIARVLSICVSQRAVDGLLLALDDRFEVRFQCGRSLAAIANRTDFVRIDSSRVYEVVLREVSVGRPVWESHRLLDAIEDGNEGVFVDRFISERAGQSMAHVFTLLSLVLHREPLQIAFRGLHVSDPLLRGTALEYLESVLPDEIRSRLWPFLEDAPRLRGSARTREEIVADLLGSNDSIMLRLAELEGAAPAAPASAGVGRGRPWGRYE
jgi:hypothetical protein